LFLKGIDLFQAHVKIINVQTETQNGRIK